MDFMEQKFNWPFGVENNMTNGCAILSNKIGPIVLNRVSNEICNVDTACSSCDFGSKHILNTITVKEALKLLEKILTDRELRTLLFYLIKREAK